MTGVITSAGVVAPIGVSPDASIVAIKVLDANNRFCCTSDIVAGLDWILANRPDVGMVNMSLVTDAQFAGDCDNAAAFTQALASAINALRANGALSFASSGNTGSGSMMTAPACVASAISVGAVYDSDIGSITILGCTDPVTFADAAGCGSWCAG